VVLVARQRDLADLGARQRGVVSGCGSPCRGSSPRTRRRRRRAASGHIASSFARRRRAALARLGESTVFFARRLAGRPSQQARARAAAGARAPARLRSASRVVAAHRVGDLGQVAHARAGTTGQPGACCGAWPPGAACPSRAAGPSAASRGAGLVERGDAVVVEAAGHGAEHRHLVGRLPNASRLRCTCLAHVAQRVLRALAVELVDRDERRRSRACRSSRAGSRRRTPASSRTATRRPAARSPRRPGRCPRSRR
jgi:hypothetical protein